MKHLLEKHKHLIKGLWYVLQEYVGIFLENYRFLFALRHLLRDIKFQGFRCTTHDESKPLPKKRRRRQPPVKPLRI